MSEGPTNMPTKLNRAFVKWLVKETEESATLANEIIQKLSRRSSSSLLLSTSPSSSLSKFRGKCWERLTSWKFPGTLAIDVEDVEALLRSHQGTAGELYILLLELAYDRIHFVLRLLAEFARTGISDEQKLSEAEGEWTHEDADGCFVASAARFVWSQLQLRAEWCHRHLASLDEARVALASRLASVTEANVALEKTIVALNRRPSNAPPENMRYVDLPGNNGRANSLAANFGNIDSQRATKEQRKEDSLSTMLITPEDDPLADMTRELAANQARIEALTRQNERISRLMARISEHRRDGGDNEQR